MSDAIQNAIQAAVGAKPTDFKDQIYAEIGKKVQDALQLKKMQISNAIFNNKDENSDYDDSEFATEEENVDEDL
jgi:hypothetical protein